MKFSATTVLLAAALGVSAHPSGHAHQRAHAARSLEERQDFVMAQRPETSTTSTSTTPTPTQTQPTATAAPTSGSGSGSGGSGKGVSVYTEFCSDDSKRKRAELADIMYAGNVGSDGSYGCNLMLAQSSVAKEYKYKIELENVSGSEQECVCFLKIGPTGGVNGFFNGNEALKFTIPAGETQWVVADDNTQGGCACDKGSVPLTSFGEFASTWLEFDVGNSKNNGWSGADASCLVSAASGLDIPGLNVCGHGTCSTINPGGTGKNAFLGGMEALDGLGLNIPAGEVHISAQIGYSGGN